MGKMKTCASVTGNLGINSATTRDWLIASKNMNLSATDPIVVLGTLGAGRQKTAKGEDIPIATNGPLQRV